MRRGRNNLVLWPLRLVRFWNKVNRYAEDYLRRHEDSVFKQNLIGHDVLLENALLEGQCAVGDRTRLIGDIHIGRYTIIGYENILHGGCITIGRFCQFGPRVAIYAVDHTLEHITPYNNRLLFHGDLKALSVFNPVEVGHAVWIGHGVTILPGVKIGNGAVIGAGAVVTKNVGDYEIAVGNPAKVIKKRFDDQIIEALCKWQWWQFDLEEIERHRKVFFMNTYVKRQDILSYLQMVMASAEYQGDRESS
jgi:virginiamycin A acetyltransferase